MKMVVDSHVMQQHNSDGNRFRLGVEMLGCCCQHTLHSEKVLGSISLLSVSCLDLVWFLKTF